MKPAFESITRRLPVRTIVVLFVAIMLVSSSSSLFAQSPQLTLADLLIGLRSKKVSLDERNVILSGAVASRGVTFSLTPEIERELLSTGAKMTLLDSIRKKAPIVKVSTVSNPEPKPVPPPPPPDFSFYEKRAATAASSGNAAAAITDFQKRSSSMPARFRHISAAAVCISEKVPLILRSTISTRSLKHCRRTQLRFRVAPP